MRAPLLILLIPTFFLPLALPDAASAQVRDDPDLLAARGAGEITHDEFAARVDRIPPEMRFRVVRDRARMEDLLNKLLIDAQLAAEARAVGFDKDPLVQERLALAMREELARAWIEHRVDEDAPADYTALARERWMLNRDQFMTPETIDVAHILIGTDTRNEEEALARAREVYDKVVANPSRFAELVREYSDDSGSSGRGGTYLGVKRGDMVAPFEEAAFGLEVGAVSEPVRTQYGYHVIRLDAVHPPEPQPFEAVQAQLEAQEREKHRERKRLEVLQPLYAEPLEVTPESVENSIRQVFGPEVLAEGGRENAAR